MNVHENGNKFTKYNNKYASAAVYSIKIVCGIVVVHANINVETKMFENKKKNKKKN